MKLNIIDLTKRVLKPSKPQLPRLRISRNGIALNKEAVKALNWKEGDKVTIAEDEHSPGDWYIFECNTGVPLSRNKKSEELRFLRVALYDHIAARLEFTGRQTFQLATVPIHYNGMELYAIITAPLLLQQREAKEREALEQSNQRTTQRLTQTA